jgi:hypothetical protein
VPFCFVLPLIVSVFEAFVRGEADLATGTPLAVYLTSGSWPTFPTKITLFTLFAMPYSSFSYEHPLVLPHSRQR